MLAVRRYSTPIIAGLNAGLGEWAWREVIFLFQVGIHGPAQGVRVLKQPWAGDGKGLPSFPSPPLVILLSLSEFWGQIRHKNSGQKRTLSGRRLTCSAGVLGPHEQRAERRGSLVWQTEDVGGCPDANVHPSSYGESLGHRAPRWIRGVGRREATHGSWGDGLPQPMMPGQRRERRWSSI